MSTSVRVYGTEKDKKAGNISLGVDVKSPEICDEAYATAVRVQFQNWRQGTSSSKTRGEVKASTRKPWKQKGTGRARAGTARSPIWRSGGVTFGPRPGTRKLKLNQKLRSKVLAAIFNLVCAEDRLSCLDFVVKSDLVKTSQAHKFLKSVGLGAEKLTLFLNSDNLRMSQAFRNMPGVNVVFFDQPNVFDLSGAGKWVFLKEDKELFEGMVGQWI